MAMNLKVTHVVPRSLRRQVKRILHTLKRQEEKRASDHLVALGREIAIEPEISLNYRYLGQGDGEWSVCPANLRKGGICYSFGVGRDVSFDLDLIDQFGMCVFAFDPTPKSIAWVESVFPTLPTEFRFHPWGVADYDGDASFHLPPEHGCSFKMYDGDEEKPPGETSVGKVFRLETTMQRLGHETVDLVKIDIEGAEVSVIPEIAAMSTRIGQVLVEFHHRMAPDLACGMQETRHAIQLLSEAGFVLFNVSPRRLEYSFINRNRLT